MFRIAGRTPLGVLVVSLVCVLLTGCDSDKPIVVPAGPSGAASSPSEKTPGKAVSKFKSPGGRPGPE